MSSEEDEGSLDDHPGAAPLGPLERELWPIGRRVNLPQFCGRSLGDDVSWRPESGLRIVALQTAGTGSDRYVWGRFWASTLEDLGADIGVLSETRILTEGAHVAACRGMRDGGYHALSHNCDLGAGDPRIRPLEPLGLGPRSSGVTLAIKATHPAGWRQVAYGPHGRAVAASVDLTPDLELRILALYGVSGACLPGFQHRGAAQQ